MSDDDATQQWILDNKKVCLCMGIPRKTVTAAIRGGAHTVPEVNKVAGCGKGGCGGKRCGATITELLAEFKDTGTI